MSSLRFQVTAIATVTIALVGGIAVGQLARRPPPSQPAADQTDQLDALRQRNQQLAAELKQLSDSAQGQARDQAALLDRVAPAVLDHSLTGVSVVLVLTPSGLAAAPELSRLLALAGATLTGQVRLTDAFTDPSHAEELLHLTTASLPPSVAPAFPATNDGVRAASALLADVLVQGPTAVGADDRRRVLTAYTGQGYLTTDGVSGAAHAALLVTGAATNGTAALMTLVGQLRERGLVVVGADGAGATVASQVRADPTLTTVSTVDNAGSAYGHLICVWALAAAVAGHTGRYGESALPPLVAPMPSPPSATASPGASPAPSSSARPTSTSSPVR